MKVAQTIVVPDSLGIIDTSYEEVSCIVEW